MRRLFQGWGRNNGGPKEETGAPVNTGSEVSDSPYVTPSSSPAPAQKVKGPIPVGLPETPKKVKGPIPVGLPETPKSTPGQPRRSIHPKIPSFPPPTAPDSPKKPPPKVSPPKPPTLVQGESSSSARRDPSSPLPTLNAPTPIKEEAFPQKETTPKEPQASSIQTSTDRNVEVGESSSATSSRARAETLTPENAVQREPSPADSSISFVSNSTAVPKLSIDAPKTQPPPEKSPALVVVPSTPQEEKKEEKSSKCSDTSCPCPDHPWNQVKGLSGVKALVSSNEASENEQENDEKKEETPVRRSKSLRSFRRTIKSISGNQHGVHKAIGIFRGLVKGNTNKDVVEQEWTRLCQEPPILTILPDIDFSDLQKYLDEAEREKAEAEVKKKTSVNNIISQGVISNSIGGAPPPPPPGGPPPPPPPGGPPPPPPPGGPLPPPPPPPGKGGGPPPPPGLPSAGPQKKKLKPVRIAQAFVKPNSDSLWSNLAKDDLCMDDVLEQFEVKEVKKERKTTKPDLSPSPIEQPGPLTGKEIMDLGIMFKGLPRGEKLTAAIRSMDHLKINRSFLDRLLECVNKPKFTEMIKKVRDFHKESPNVPLKDEEALLLLLDQTKGLKDNLNLWRIRDDCEAMEREICEPLNAIMTSIRLLKDSKELRLVLGVTLKLINLMKGTKFPAVKIQELHKLKDTNDNNKTSLLTHIVKKILQKESKFKGFPPELMETLDQMATTSLDSLDEKIALMESGCRDPLGFLIEQDRIEAEEQHAPGEAYYHTLHLYMNEQIIKVHTIKKIKNVIMTPFTELLEWMAIAPDGLNTQDFAKLLIDFFESVNKTTNEIKEAENKSKNQKKLSKPGRKMSASSSTPNLQEMSPMGPRKSSNLMGDLTARLGNR